MTKNNLSATTTVILAALATLAVFVACDRELDEPDGGEVTVVTTTYPLTFMTQRIGGDRVNVIQLVKPGVEAHDFEPAPSDIRTISSADVFVFNHPAFESWALAAVSASGTGDSNGEGPKSTVQTATLDDEGEDHGGQDVHDHEFDPHVWLNPQDAEIQAARITSALVSADPDGSIKYVQNNDALAAELRGLDDSIEAQLTECQLDSVVVSHLAYGHMAERYGFNQIGLAGLSPEFESGPAQIAAVVDRMNELGINHILREPIVSGRLAETVAEETGAEILVLHPLEVRTVDEISAGADYISIMKANGDALATAMECG